MKNETIFKETVEEAVSDAVEIKTVINPAVNSCKKLFKALTGMEGEVLQKHAIFTTSKDESDVKKFKKLLDLFGGLILLNEHSEDKLKISSYLSEKFGITYEVDPPMMNSKMKKVEKLWPEVFNGEEYSGNKGSKRADINSLYLRTKDFVTEMINARAGEIDRLEAIEKDCEIDPSLYKKVVSLKTDKAIGKDVDGKLEETERKIEEVRELMDLLGE